MRRKLVIIPIVAIIIVVGIVGAVLYFTRHEAISVIRPPGWKAYINEGEGFGFAYPGDWQEGTYPGVIAWFGNPTTGANVSVATESVGQMSLGEYVAASKLTIQGMFEDVSILNEEDITVSGRAGYKIIWRIKYQQIYVKEMQVYILAGGKAFALTCGVSENSYGLYESTFNQIVGTFVVK